MSHANSRYGSLAPGSLAPGSLGETVSYAGSTVGMLRAAGINDTQATMAASGMFWTVGESNVNAPVTQVIVRAVQRMLNHLSGPGEQLFVDGILNSDMQRGLLKHLGPGFPQMTWAGVFASLRNKLAQKKSDFILNEEPDLMPMGDFGGVGLGTLLIGGGILYLLFGRKGSRR